MKVKVDALKSVVSTVRKVVPNRATKPVLSCIAFDSNRSIVYGTNLEKTIVVEMPDLDFSCCVPASILSDLLNTLTGVATFELSGDSLVVTSERGEDAGRTVIKVLPLDEILVIPEVRAAWKDAPATLLDDIGRVVFCAAKDSSRPVLTGVLFGGGMAAADGFKLAKSGEIANGVIIPASTLEMLSSIFSKSEQIQFAIDKRVAAFKSGNTTIFSQLIEDNYPNVEAIIPKNTSKTWTLKQADAIQALRQVLVTSDASMLVVVERADEGIVFMTEDAQSGQSAVMIDAGGSPTWGEQFAVNGSFLLQAIDACDETVEMGFNNAASPILLRAKNRVYVIMPMAMRKK